MCKQENETSTYRSVVQDGMRIDWDVPIRMDDGIIVRADIYRPCEEGKYPVLLTYGPYAKGLHFQDGYPPFWATLERRHPEVLQGTTGKYLNWETVDPERWVPEGYICIRVDSRGAGRSEGVIDPWSPRETRDIYACIEWAGVQPWSNGKIGLLGISYLAANQWQVAEMQPPHLAAICPFEGYSDMYREGARHGGILHTFTQDWFPLQVKSVQHGLGVNGRIGNINGDYISGPETLSPEELAAHVIDFPQEFSAHELLDDFYKARTPDLTKVKVPLLSCGNWGGNSLHLRGNIEGYLRAGSEQKWLEIHGLEHFTEFYTDYGRRLQKRFFDHFLKGLDTWSNQPPVYLRLRNVNGTFTDRAEQEWPLARTQWTKLYLDPQQLKLTNVSPQQGQVEFHALEEGVTFLTPPLEEEIEITGPLAAKLFAASSTNDADIFITMRVLDPEGKDVTFISANDPKGVIALGWLRASHRKLDPELSLTYRPWHTHDEKQLLTPGEVYELDVEIWPTSVIIPAGYRLGITIRGKDFEFSGEGPWPIAFGREFRGNAIYLHKSAVDRPEAIYGGKTTLVTTPEKPAYLLVPIIPHK